MRSAPKTAWFVAFAAAIAAYPVAASAADYVVVVPPGPPAPTVVIPVPTGIPGCYEAVSGFPAGFGFSFCLTVSNDGDYRLVGPGFACSRAVDWSQRHDGTIHIDLRKLFTCDGANQVITDDIYCTVASGGLNCTFDNERGLVPGSFFAARVY